MIKVLQSSIDAASDVTVALRLFSGFITKYILNLFFFQLTIEIDEDGSGELDEQEFAHLIKSIGIDMSESEIHETMDEYDIDQGGVIGIDEFLLFLRNNLKDTKMKLKEVIN